MEGEDDAQSSALEFIFEPILSALDDPITAMTTAAKVRASRGRHKQTMGAEQLRAMHSCRCLDLSNGRLAREPFLPEQLTSLTSLRLGHNGIKGIQDATMLAFTALTWLELHDNHLSELPQEWRLWGLKGLLLHNNQITHLPPAISGLTSLSTLTLAGNKLHCPSPGASPDVTALAAPNDDTLGSGRFGSLRALEVLDLSRNRLCALPAGITALGVLRRLVIDRNSIELLPDLSLHRLEVLSATDNRLSCLPSSITVLTTLEVLELSGNLLSTLQSTCSMPHLTRLCAARNRLRGLHTTVSSALEVLDLSHNSIEQIAYDAFKVVVGLQVLDLSHNRLQGVPFSLGTRTALKTLRLGSNALQSLDFIDNLSKRPASGGLRSLQTLVLANNELKTVPDAVGLLESLTHLDLHANQLSLAPPRLCDCAHLKEVLLGLNQLSTMPVEWADFSSLQVLHVSGNPNLTIEKVPKAIRHTLVGTWPGGSGGMRISAPSAAGRQGALARLQSNAPEADSEGCITLTTGAKVALTVPFSRPASDAQTQDAPANISGADALCPPLKDMPHAGQTAVEAPNHGEGEPVVNRPMALTRPSSWLPGKGGIVYSGTGTGHGWAEAGTCAWDPLALDAVNLMLHGPFNKDLAKETQEALQAQARRKAVLAKEEERATARRAQRARLQDRQDIDKDADWSSAVANGAVASTALGRIDAVLEKIRQQRAKSAAASAVASTAASETGSVLHEEQGRDVDFNQVPVPADLLHGDALGFGMFDIFDIAARQRSQRYGGEKDNRGEARTAWRPSYMRSKSTYSASMLAGAVSVVDAKSQEKGRVEAGPFKFSPAKVENDTKSSRPLASTGQVARGDGHGKRKAMGIAEILLPPQIIPNTSKSKLAGREEVSVW